MSELERQVADCAEQMLEQGEYPSSERVAAQLDLDPVDTEAVLLTWIAQRMQSSPRKAEVRVSPRTEIPDLITRQVDQIWKLALDEAVVIVREEIDSNRVSDEEERRTATDMVRDAEGRYRDLERRSRDQAHHLEQAGQTIKGLEAEISVLKANLASETNLRKKQEQQRANAESELAQLRKQLEDTKRTFDQRIKEEQRMALESVSRAEVETRHYRNALEKMRDESGRSEAELTRSLHELQAQMARKEARVEMADSTIKELEAQAEELKQTLGTYSREIAQLNARVLKESNANRRFETQIKEQEEEIRRLNQRISLSANESSKRENSLRQQLKDRDEQLTRSTARVNSLEKRVTAQEDQIRRLNARI